MPEKGNKKGMFRYVLKAIKIIASLLAIFLVLLFVYFSIFKDDIAGSIIQNANERLSGELRFETVSISPIYQFPHLSISLKEVSYFSSKPESRDSVENAMIYAERLYLETNLISLLKSKMDVSGLHLKSGSVQLIQFPDSTFNITEAFQVSDKRDRKREATKKEIDLYLDNISISDIRISFDDRVENEKSVVLVEKLSSSFHANMDTMAVRLRSKVLLEHLPIYGLVDLKDRELKIESDLNILRKDSVLNIGYANLKLDDSSFDLDGLFNFSGRKEIDLNFKLRGEGLEIVSQILAKKGYKGIRNGRVSVEGSLLHDFSDRNAMLKCAFGIEDLTLQIPGSDHMIRHLFLNGAFNTGEADDLSEAYLMLDTLYGSIDEGSLNASFEVENFVSPKLETHINAKLDIDHYDELLQIEYIEELQGGLVLQVDYVGERLSDSSWTHQEGENLYVEFDKVSFSIPQLKLDNRLDGVLSGTSDSLRAIDMKLNAGNTDLLINGDILKLSSLFTSQKLIEARNVSVKAELFDLPGLIEMLPDSRKGFRDRFRYMLVDTEVFTDIVFSMDTSEANRHNPFLYIDVVSGSATLDSLLPPAELSDVHLNIAKIDSSVCVDISHFDINFEQGRMLGDMVIDAHKNKTGMLDINVEAVSLDPKGVFSHYKADSLKPEKPVFLNGKLSTQLTYSSLDTLRQLESVFAKLGPFELLYPDDTVLCKELTLDLKPFMFNKKRKPIPFATLTSEFAISIDSLYSNKGFIKKLQSTGSVEEGAYFINELKSESLLQSGTGELFFEPFSENPQFRINYNLDESNFEKLFERLHKDPTIFGTMDARIQLSGEGVTRDEIIQSLNGEVVLDGKDLVLRGLDLDNLIRKMGRTQKFNLVDVAGVVVAGPLGLAVTKGSDAASLFINNPEDSTIIVKIVSDYDIVNGELELDDVAFSTLDNRVAFKGHYDLVTDSIGIVAAVIDSTGAITWHQILTGTAKEPQLSKIRPVAALLKPIDNLFKDMLEIKGKQFYDGRVEHPVDRKKKNE